MDHLGIKERVRSRGGYCGTEEKESSPLTHGEGALHGGELMRESNPIFNDRPTFILPEENNKDSCPKADQGEEGKETVYWGSHRKERQLTKSLVCKKEDQSRN